MHLVVTIDGVPAGSDPPAAALDRIGADLLAGAQEGTVIVGESVYTWEIDDEGEGEEEIMGSFDDDRDDIDYDDSDEAMLTRAIDRIARLVLDELGYDAGSDELGIPASNIPTAGMIRRSALDYRGGPATAIRLTKDLLWPGWDQDCRRPQPPCDLEDQVVGRARELCGAEAEVR